jgi:hypothetical protein
VEKGTWPHGKPAALFFFSSLCFTTFVAVSTNLSQATGTIVGIMGSLHLRERKVADAEFTTAAGTSSPTTKEVYEEGIDDGSNHVPEKYRGTAADRHDMAVMGNKQVLRVSIPTNIATVLALILSSETSLLLPWSDSHLHV